MKDGVEVSGGGSPRAMAGADGARRTAFSAGGPRRSRAACAASCARVLGLAATLVLLGVGVAVVLTLTRDNDFGRRRRRPSRRPRRRPPPPPPSARRRARRPRGSRTPRRSRAARPSARCAARASSRWRSRPTDPRRALRVLIGRPKASSTGVRGGSAFFFEREQYLGTDAASPSLRLQGRKPEGQSDHARLHALRRRRQAVLPQRRHGQGPLQEARGRAPDAAGTRSRPHSRRLPPS